MQDVDIKKILQSAKTIAVIGLSDKQDRPSFQVASYLQNAGYKIIPVNPNIKEWEGMPAFPSLSAIPESIDVDVVDVFRKSEDVPAVVEDALAKWKTNPKTLWLQLGVTNPASEKKAKDAGWQVISNKCMKIEHEKLNKNK